MESLVERGGADAAGTCRSSGLGSTLAVAAGLWVPLLTIALIALFSILLPNTFPTWLNFRSILGDKSIVCMLALAATCR